MRVSGNSPNMINSNSERNALLPLSSSFPAQAKPVKTTGPERSNPIKVCDFDSLYREAFLLVYKESYFPDIKPSYDAVW